jgi:hypothetical protein
MTSIIKVDNLQNQCGANIISESANVITIGASGDTVTLAAGASQSGFGRSGSVNWDTTPKTSSPVTAVSGNGYFINTTSGAITVNLPATPSAGSIVSIADYNGTAATNAITVGRNSSNINSSAADFTISRNYAAISFVYVDSTAGWRSVDTSDASSVVNQFVAATGGTITTCGNYKIHTFTGPGTFTVTNTGPQSSTVDYLVVAGGGAGAGGVGGGGGAGGFRESVPAPAAWTASPLASPGGSLPVSVTAYPITVGAGATKNVGPSSGRGSPGNNSVFSTITSTGGGGAGGDPNSQNGLPGGSGGGGSRSGPSPIAGGSGNTPPVSPSQGNNGEPGLGVPARGGGGGGAGAAGGTGTQTYGGSGVGTAINPGPGVGTPGPSPSLRYFAGGGGGGGDWPYTGQGANGGTIGGGGPSYQGPFTPATPGEYAIDGTANTGGGGGGGSNSGGSSGGASGGSGIVVIRYRFQ